MTASRAIVAALVVLASATSALPASAQAWVPRAREGDVTFVVQTIDHIGRISQDSWTDCCVTTNVAFVVDAHYGLTSRLSISAGLPYVFARFYGNDPTKPQPTGPPLYWYTKPAVDACKCLHSSFQDVSVGAHYNLVRVRRSFSLTTSMTTGVPSHAYPYAGEAVVGFGLKELSLSVDAGQRLDSVLPGLSIDGRYAYTLVEQVLDMSHNRSNIGLDAGYTFPKRLVAHVLLSSQRTHGGLSINTKTGDLLMPDGLLASPEFYTEFHRVLQDNYFQAGGGASYTWRVWDVSFSFLKTVSGYNTHNVHVYTISASRSFRLSR